MHPERELTIDILTLDVSAFCPLPRARKLVLATYFIELLGQEILVLPVRYACLGVWEILTYFQSGK